MGTVETQVASGQDVKLISGGQIVAKFLKQEGVNHIFTISGGHIIDIYNGCLDEGIRIVDVRHEQVAAHAADAYARITGNLGCAVVTAGPGTTDAVTGVANAFRAESPMLLIGGGGPLKQYKMGALQDLAHVPMMTPITKFASTVMTTERCAEMMSQAVREMYNGAPGPGYLEIPHDVLDAKVDASKVRIPKNYRVRGEFIGDPNELARAADVIANAERPVVLFGTQTRTCRAHEAVDRFARHFNIPVYVNGAARGTLPRNHPYNFMPSRRVAFDNADVIFLVGTPLDFRMGYGRRLNPKAKVIILDMDYKNVGYNRDFDIGLVGNIRAILNAMCEASKGDVARKHDPFIKMLREEEEKTKSKNDKIIKDDSRVPIHPLRLVHEINEFLLEDTVFIGDGGDIVTFSGSVVKPHKPGGWMDPGPLGTLGVGTGFALASKLLQPERDVVVLFGDGSFGLTGFDFETMVRNKLPFVGVIGNNASWNQIRYGQAMKYGKERGDVGNVTADVRFDRFAEAMGGFGIRVTEPSQIRPALEKARDSGVPALVDVVIDREVYSSGTMNQTMYK
ncbi:thiamine pyrophosphate-binding protein [Pelomicrobium methylotrophicum]|uniref:Acetolactate synthase n=1 Tax=Pelomicrobium methylotrophicum TaxID=2602750 RepID=A0A5C7ESI5_9PROT|nr:thiamine pyrophosphate-binding protein [Pelomicrobium methylotrophicum]TXF09941.1 acetolactate synthase [Pelomicrobium methylotrophicum]